MVAFEFDTGLRKKANVAEEKGVRCDVELHQQFNYSDPSDYKNCVCVNGVRASHRRQMASWDSSIYFDFIWVVLRTTRGYKTYGWSAPYHPMQGSFYELG